MTVLAMWVRTAFMLTTVAIALEVLGTIRIAFPMESSADLPPPLVADSLILDQFRERMKTNLAQEGDFVLVNYDRRVLQQSGAGHISAVGAYDEARDAFLVLDEAAYRYPFTWVPAPLLYKAVHTRADRHYRGVLFVQRYASPSA